MTLNIGPDEMVDPRQYTSLAAANFADGFGEALVVCNDSTHLLVLIRPYPEEVNAQLVVAFRYGATDYEEQYAAALKRMVHEALLRSDKD